MFYTYAHYRADDHRIFYIGKGIGPRYIRRSDRNKHWHHIANKHGFHAEILAKWENESDAFAHEKFLIKTLRETGHPLVNYTDGGEGASGVTFSAERRKAISDRTKGKKLSPEHIEKVRQANIGRKCSEETKQKLRIANLGKKYSDEIKKKVSAAGRLWIRDAAMRQKLSLSHKGMKKPSLNKPVRCLTLNLDFKSVKAAGAYLVLNPSSIGRCCNKTLLTTGKLQFEWIKNECA